MELIRKSIFLIVFLASFFTEAQEDKDFFLARKKITDLLKTSIEATKNEEYKKSDSIFTIALAKADSLQDDVSFAYCYNHRGILNSKLGNTKEAILFHSKALRIALKNPKEHVLLSKTYGNLAHGYLYLQKYDSAIYFLKKGETLYSKNMFEIDSVYKVKNAYNSGFAHFHMKNFQVASEKFEEAIEKSKIALLHNITAASYGFMAFIKKEQKEIKESFKYIDSSIAIATKNKLPYLTLEAYEIKEELYLEKKDFKNSYLIKNIVSKIRDSLQEVSKLNQVKELKIKYEYDFLKKKNKLLILEKNAREANLKKNKIILIISIIGLFVLLGFLYQLYTKNKIKKKSIELLKTKNKNLIQLKNQSEINFLKSQIKPHFFFNLLNNIYALSLLKSEKTTDALVKASNLMEYVTYQEDDMVLLKDEIEFINNYISFEKTVKSKKLNVTVDCDQSLYHLMIYPLLFNPIIENAFKHGNTENEESFYLNISFSCEEKELICTFENSVNSEENKFSHFNNTEGIGIPNLTKRLNLLYNKDYTFQRTTSEKKFVLILKLPL